MLITTVITLGDTTGRFLGAQDRDVSLLAPNWQEGDPPMLIERIGNMNGEENSNWIGIEIPDWTLFTFPCMNYDTMEWYDNPPIEPPPPTPYDEHTCVVETVPFDDSDNIVTVDAGAFAMSNFSGAIAARRTLSAIDTGVDIWYVQCHAEMRLTAILSLNNVTLFCNGITFPSTMGVTAILASGLSIGESFPAYTVSGTNQIIVDAPVSIASSVDISIDFYLIATGKPAWYVLEDEND